MAVASGAMAVAGTAHADSAADGTASGSPGLGSGNTIQVPVDIPVNVCGNTVDVIGLLNPAMGNKCTNSSHKAPGKTASAGSRNSGQATADSSTHDSPGILSGNGVEVPVHAPVNLSGNSVNVVGVGNPVFGNESTNGPSDEPAPSTPSTPRVHPQPHHPAKAHPRPTTVVRQRTTDTLAHTGAASPWAPAMVSLASLAAGAVLYRRFRPGASNAPYA